MWIFWIILLVVIGVALMIYSWTGDGWQGPAGMFSFMLLLAATTILNGHVNPKPTALDVYQGNTELKITSVNGVPTDTVVVFKNK
jgi:hypothetical protein